MPKKKKSVGNPNGANQYQPDPRQALFLSYYLDPKSETFSNALQSALKAGYQQEYAESITAKSTTWLAESVGDQFMLSKAERNLDKFLDLETLQPIITMIGPLIDKETGEVMTKENHNLLKIKSDVSKFVAERLGRDKYATRKEHTGKDGGPISIAEVLDDLDNNDRPKIAGQTMAHSAPVQNP